MEIDCFKTTTKGREDFYQEIRFNFNQLEDSSEATEEEAAELSNLSEEEEGALN